MFTWQAKTKGIGSELVDMLWNFTFPLDSGGGGTYLHIPILYKFIRTVAHRLKKVNKDKKSLISIHFIFRLICQQNRPL